MGLWLCPAEIGPQLRLQYEDQKDGEYIRIAMKGISDAVGELRLFKLYRNLDYFWLGYETGDPENLWFDESFVFLSSKY
jgi:hypothetical protein